MPDARMRRVNEAVRAVLGDAIAKDLQDPRVGFVTVTDVKTSPDLSQARIYVSAIDRDGHTPAPSDRESTLAGLRSAHGYLQHRVAEELHLKRTPVLTFVYDDTSERAQRLGELIDAASGAGAEATRE